MFSLITDHMPDPSYKKTVQPRYYPLHRGKTGKTTAYFLQYGQKTTSPAYSPDMTPSRGNMTESRVMPTITDRIVIKAGSRMDMRLARRASMES